MPTLITIIIILFASFNPVLSQYLITKRLRLTVNPNCTSNGSNTHSLISIINCDNTLYITQLNVGTPSVNLTVVVDTGSNTLWLPDTNCVNQTLGIYPYPICSSNKFNLNASSTSTITNQYQQIDYGDGSAVAGYFGTDIISFPGSTINVNSQILWVQYQIYMDITFDGIIGLGYDSSYNIFDYAYEAGQISSNIFAFQLSLTNSSSILYFNTIPEQIVNTTYFLDQYKTNYWQVQLIGFKADNKDMSSKASSKVILDTGTSLFFLNNDLFNQISNQFFSNCSQDYLGLLACPCSNNFPTLSFYFKGIKTFIYGQNYTQVINSTYCQVNFAGTSMDSNLLGDIFLQNYIVTFDKFGKKIGFSGNYDLISLVGQNNTHFFLIGQIIAVSIASITVIFLTILMFTLPIQINFFTEPDFDR